MREESNAAAERRPLSSRRLVKTKTPGVYQRGGGYVVVYRDPSGRQRKRAAKTLAGARALKSSLATDVRRGEWREHSRVTFADYAVEWIDTYAGRTTRGFRENTRDEYRRDLGFDSGGKPIDRAAVFFGRMRLAEIEPRTVKQYLAKLARDGLAPATIRRLLAPLRAMLATAAEEGAIRFNPAAGVRVPAAATRLEPTRKDLTPEEVEALLAALPARWSLLVEFLLQTGLRASEVIALEWRDVDFGRRRVRIERRFYKGIDAPKSDYGRRAVPITSGMARRL